MNRTVTSDSSHITLQFNSHEKEKGKGAELETGNERDTDEGNPYSKHYQPDSGIWSLYLKETEKEDKELAASLQIGLDELLIFAGLFGAILTAFLIESRKDLQESPVQQLVQELSQSTVSTSSSEHFRPLHFSLVVNYLWFTSLCLTLFSALSAVLARGWLARYIPVTPGERSSDACERFLRAKRAQQWQLEAVVTGIPLLIQVALFLFSVGLIFFIVNESLGISIVILVLTALAVVLYFISTILPWFSPASPFQTTFSNFIPGAVGKERYDNDTYESEKYYHKYYQSNRLAHIYEHISLSMRAVMDFLKDAHHKPKRTKVEAEILAWVIARSSSERAIEEAVVAVAGACPSEELRDALCEEAVIERLCYRFNQCFKIVPDLVTVIDAARAEIYILAMIRLLQPLREPRELLNLPLLEGLLDPGQPLHRDQWDGLKLCLKALACALRIHIHLGTSNNLQLCWNTTSSNENQNIKTAVAKMAGMASTPYVRKILFSAACLGSTSKMLDLRESCEHILIIQIQFSDIRREIQKKIRRKKDVPKCIMEQMKDQKFLSNKVVASYSTKFDDINNQLDVESNAATTAPEFSKQSEDERVSKVIRFLEDSDWQSRLSGLNTLAEFSEQARFRARIINAIPKVVSLLRDSDSDVRSGAVTALAKMSKQDELHPSIKSTIPKIIDLLKQEEIDFRLAGGDVLVQLSKQDGLCVLIKESIPEFVKLLEDEDDSSIKLAANSLSSLSERVELRSAIRDAIPKIVQLFTHSYWQVRSNAADVLAKLSKQADFWADIKDEIPKVILLLEDNDSDVQSSGVKLLAEIHANSVGHLDVYQDTVKGAISKVIDLFENSDHVQPRGASALAMLSEQASFRPILNESGAILKVVHLLDNVNGKFRLSGVDALAKLSGHAEFYSTVKSSVPRVIELLLDDDSDVQLGAAEALVQLSTQGEYLSNINSAVPATIRIAENLDLSRRFRRKAVNILLNLSKEVECRLAMENNILTFVKLLDDKDWLIRLNGLQILAEMSKEDKCSISVQDAVPKIMGLLEDNDSDVQSEAAETLLKLSRQLKVKTTIKEGVTAASKLLEDSDSESRTRGIYILANLSEQDEFRESIKETIPKIISLLEDSDSTVRYRATDALIKLCEPVEFRGTLRDAQAVPKIIDILEDYDFDVRSSGAKALAKLSELAEFRSFMRDFVPRIVRLLEHSRAEIRSSGADILIKLSEQDKLLPDIKHFVPTALGLHQPDTNTQSAIPSSLRVIDKSDQNLGISGIWDPDMSSRFATSTNSMHWTRTMIDLLTSNHNESRYRGIEALLKLSEFALRVAPRLPVFSTQRIEDKMTHLSLTNALRHLEDFQNTIKDAISKIINLLKDSDSVVYSEVLATLVNLSKQDEFPTIKNAIPPGMKLLEDRQWNFRIRGVDVLSGLSEQVKFQSEIKEAIPKLINLLEDNDPDVQREAKKLLLKLSKQAEFRDAIKESIPAILKLLDSGNWTDRLGGIDILAVFLGKDETLDTVKKAIPKIIQLIQDDDSDVRSRALEVLADWSEDAALQTEMEDVIPKVVEFFNSGSVQNQLKGAKILANLADQFKFRAAIGDVVPKVSDLLSHESDTQIAVADILIKLSNRSEFNVAIKSAISKVMDILEDEDPSVQLSGAKALACFCKQDELQSAVEDAVAKIIGYLDDDDLDIRTKGAKILAPLSEQVQFLPAIGKEIPKLIELLEDVDSNVRSTAAQTLVKISGNSGYLNPLRESRKDVAAVIVTFLKDSELDVQSRISALEIVANLAAQGATKTNIDEIIKCLDDKDSLVRSKASDILVRLSEHAELQDEIKKAIPSIMKLISNEDPVVQSSSSNALAKLSEKVEFRSAMTDSIQISPIIKLLESSDSDIRSNGAKTLTNISKQADLRVSVHAAIPDIIRLLEDSEWQFRSIGVKTLAGLLDPSQPEFGNEMNSKALFDIAHSCGLLIQSDDMETVEAGSDLFAKLVIYGDFDEMILRRVIDAFIWLYSSDLIKRKRGATVIGVLGNSPDTFKVFLKHVGAIVSFIRHFTPDYSSEQTRVIVENMMVYGVLKIS